MEAEEVIQAIEDNFRKNILPEWEELERRTYRRGNITIVDLRG